MYKISQKYFSLLLFFFGFFLQMFLIILVGNLGSVALQPSGIRPYVSKTLMVLCLLAILICVYGLYLGFSEMFRQNKIFLPCVIGIFFNLIWLFFWIFVTWLGFSGY